MMKTDLTLMRVMYIIIVEELSNSDIYEQYIAQVHQKDN